MRPPRAWFRGGHGDPRSWDSCWQVVFGRQPQAGKQALRSNRSGTTDMNDPTQYLIDPATGNLVPGRWVCPSCKTVNGGPRCGYSPCGWMRPVATVPDTSVVIVDTDDDDSEPDEPTWPLDNDKGGES